MKNFRLLLLAFLFTYLNSACIKQVEVPIRNEKPQLVVQGLITNDSLPYEVKVSFSGPFTSRSVAIDEYVVKDAKVLIRDNLGNATQLAYRDSGIYVSTDPNFVGQVGRSYHVEIGLADGSHYVSTPETIRPPVPIDSVSKVEYSLFFDKLDLSFGSNPYSDRLNAFIDFKDPPDQENYYRWSSYNYVLRKCSGIPCGFGCTMYEYCYQLNVVKELQLLSDASVNGNLIHQKQVEYSYIYWFGKQYVDIGQLSISREAYQFWERYQEQLTRTGSILDPLPSPIKGNVHNAVDTTDIALGYFEASSITHKRVVLVPFGITQFLLDQRARQYIPSESAICFEYFPNTLPYPPPPAQQYPPPPGWENAQQLIVNW